MTSPAPCGPELHSAPVVMSSGKVSVCSSTSNLGTGTSETRPKADSMGGKFESMKEKLKQKKRDSAVAAAVAIAAVAADAGSNTSGGVSESRRRTLSTGNGDSGDGPRGRCVSFGSLTARQRAAAAAAQFKAGQTKNPQPEGSAPLSPQPQQQVWSPKI